MSTSRRVPGDRRGDSRRNQPRAEPADRGPKGFLGLEEGVFAAEFERGAAAVVFDRIHERGFNVRETYPHQRVHIVETPGVDPPAVQEIPGIVKVQPNSILPFFSMGAVDFAANPFSLSLAANAVREIPISQGVEQTSLPRIRRMVNAEALNDGSGAVIAIFDTGVSSAVIPPERQVDGFAFDRSDPWTDSVGHGSMVAGVAAADRNHFGVDGIAPGAGIVSCKVSQAGVGGFVTSSLLAANEFVMSLQDPNNIPPGFPDLPTIPADVIADQTVSNIVLHNSWGLSGCTEEVIGGPGVCGSVSVRKKILFPVSLGMSCVFAAGNLAQECGRPSQETMWCGPSVPGVVSVGALDENLQRQPYSSAGPGQCSPGNPTTMVPTFGVLPWRDGFADFGAVGGGTSAAAPVASGVIAALRTERPGQSPGSYLAAIRDGSSNVDIGRPPGFNPETGHGLLNAQRALARSGNPIEGFIDSILDLIERVLFGPPRREPAPAAARSDG